MGCDRRTAQCTFRRHDFNPRTPCGVRQQTTRDLSTPPNFNPRTPCGVRQSVNFYCPWGSHISIHAPRVGCDQGMAGKASCALISIHAPRVGCDTAPCTCITHGWNFNPRTPCGVRLRLFGLHQHPQVISIHAPRVGCDFLSRYLEDGTKISIHAPRVGCDSLTLRISTSRRNFNPRTPCGVRRSRRRGMELAGTNFNPRTPCGVRRGWPVGGTQGQPISIHAPRVGCDPLWHRSKRKSRDFNPRTPCGVRHYTPL